MGVSVACVLDVGEVRPVFFIFYEVEVAGEDGRVYVSLWYEFCYRGGECHAFLFVSPHEWYYALMI